MSAADIAATSRPALGRGFRLQWEAAQNTYVLLFPEGMIKLNGSAHEILKRCTGEATVAQITAQLEQAFQRTDLAGEVADFIRFAMDHKWLTRTP